MLCRLTLGEAVQHFNITVFSTFQYESSFFCLAIKIFARQATTSNEDLASGY